MTTPSKKPNGSKPRMPLTCPHADECAAPKMHAEVMASLDQLSTSLGLVLQDSETKSGHLDALKEQVGHALVRLADMAERMTVGEQREERWLRELGEVTRAMAQASVRAVREELILVVRDEVERAKESKE